MEFNEKIKQRREELDLTLGQVAKLVGVSAPTIQRYESGEIKNVRRDKIAKLAKALKVSPAYLMGWEDEAEDVVAEASDEHDIKTIAAHVDGEPLTDEELKEVLDFARYQIAKRKNK